MLAEGRDLYRPNQLMKKLARHAKSVILLAIVVAVIYAIESRDTNESGGLVEAAQRKALPEVTIRDLAGTSWRLSDHRGQVLLLNFWATWCPPCREETPGLVRLSKSYPQSALTVIGLSMDDGRPSVVRQFVSSYKIPYPVSMPGDNFALASLAHALPTTLLIDKEGRVAKTYVGATSEKVFRADVDALLREDVGE